LQYIPSLCIRTNNKFWRLKLKTIHIVEDTLPIAWEKAVFECWRHGAMFPTEYDQADDPNSRDVTAMIHILNPMAEPRIHRAFPGGLDDLEKYRDEVLLGVHDHWVDPSAGKWEYTYHERLFEYDIIEKEEDWEYGRFKGTYSPKERLINQIEQCVKILKNCGHTRRAQAVTWQCWKDLGIHDPACLQRLWFRIEKSLCKTCHNNHGSGHCANCDNGYISKLNMTVHMRSNDAYKASFMNMYAFVELQSYVASQLGIKIGEYVHIVDSFHIYGSYFEEFKGFLKSVKTRTAEERVYTDDFAYEYFLEGCDQLLGEGDMPKDKKKLVQKRKEDIRGFMS